MARKRFGLQEVKVNFGIFDNSMICIAGPRERVVEYVRWKCEDPDFDRDMSNVRGRFFQREGYVPIIWIPRKPRTPREHGTLAHEVLHVLAATFTDWASVPFTKDTEEVFCHALGSTVAAILEQLE